MLIIGLIFSILLVSLILVSVRCSTLEHQQQEVISLNTQIQQENEKIEEENQQLKLKKQELISGVQAQDNILRSLSATRIEMERNAETAAQKLYEFRVKEIEAKLQELEDSSYAEYERRAAILADKLKIEQERLSNIEAKQLAYIQAQQRQEEIAANQDYYRLALDQLDLNDISLLRELQPRFIKKDAIDKVIYETYYRPAYDILMSHLFSGAQKVCGIYKITDLATGQAYIGQSVDCKERFRQHIKTALSYGKATNKLYQIMQKSGVHNFTFEILEEVSRDQLNEREIYWIDFYKTRDYGMNSTKGNFSGQV